MLGTHMQVPMLCGSYFTDWKIYKDNSSTKFCYHVLDSAYVHISSPCPFLQKAIGRSLSSQATSRVSVIAAYYGENEESML